MKGALQQGLLQNSGAASFLIVRAWYMVDSLHHDAPEVGPTSVQDDDVGAEDFFISWCHFSTGYFFFFFLPQVQ